MISKCSLHAYYFDIFRFADFLPVGGLAFGWSTFNFLIVVFFALSCAMLSIRRLVLAEVDNKCAVSSIALKVSSVRTTKSFFLGQSAREYPELPESRSDAPSFFA